MVTFRIPAPKQIDFTPFQESEPNVQAKFGLPNKVSFCRVCVISNQRPNSSIEYSHTSASQKATINFDSHDVCDACKVAAQKKEINWDERESQLWELCDRHRRNEHASEIRECQ